MCKKLCFLMSFVLVLGLVGSARADFLPWAELSIGGGTPGSSEYDLETESVAVTGDGYHIDYTSDIFHYVYLPYSGDCEMIARVVNNNGEQPWRRSGVMIRQSLAADSKHCAMQVIPGPGYAHRQFAVRLTDGGDTTHTLADGTEEPCWVRLTRVGNTFTGYVSRNGSTWTQIGAPTSITMTDPFYVGLSVMGSGGSMCTATFDNISGDVRMEPYTYGPDPPRCVPSEAKPLADIAEPYDCIVDVKDLAVLADDWLKSGTSLPADLYDDSLINFKDYSLLTGSWLEEKEEELWP